ncbi:D-TA family PLP-dependent enzyme [Membranihabitans marinus]|uniref:D-TA family PLP-dependent enzyme n=1 Tax=Membranihabitans marinus TaxID=1227546 RepID=UPI001F280CA8|nr:D-TA family PLP-dependent enzyme [Membranihabitans marinus]
MATPWYTVENTDLIDSPALMIFKDRAIYNIKHLISMVDDIERLRPHVKTNKSADTIKLIMEAGIQKFKCATIAEGEMLGNCQAKDVLLAYQPVGPKMKRFITLVKTFPNTSFSCLIDHLDNAKQLGQLAESEGLVLSVYIDVNVGMNRTGIAADRLNAEWASELAKIKGIEVKGIHVYDGHIHDVDLAIRQEKVDGYMPAINKISEILANENLGTQWVIGGSPTFPIHSARENGECSPGTFIFWDKGYLEICPEQEFQPAAVLLSRVISIIDDKKLCIDLGYKSIASENPYERRVYFLNEPNGKLVGHSEEHMVVEVDSTESYSVGDIFYALPIHICPTLAMYDELLIIEDGKWTENWKTTARNRKISI